MSAEDRSRWDAKYAAKPAPRQLLPDVWLQNEVASLPPGRALELACGLGHNAIWLAGQGWQVDAVDVSPVGLELAAEFARTFGLHVNWNAADLDEFTPPEEAYDLICVFRFLDRINVPRKISSALRPGGILIYETFSTAHLTRDDSHMKNPRFALAPEEWARLFPSLQIISRTDVVLPDRSVTRLIARRPPPLGGCC